MVKIYYISSSLKKRYNIFYRNHRENNFRNSVVILLFLIAQSQTFTQSEIRCTYCQQEIHSKYIIVDGKAFHSEHFLCKWCNKQIISNFMKNDGDYYHPDCYSQMEGLICDYCKKIIDEEYTIYEDRKYHKSCYENYILPRCAVCNLTIKGKYTEDIYQNKYHSYHIKEMHLCDVCNRIICQAITNGGRDYSDGRHICNICYATAVFEQQHVETLLIKVSGILTSIGIKINIKNIKIDGVDRNDLRNKAKSFNEKTQGYCNSETLTKYINNRMVNQTINHKIFVLSGTPSLSLESTIAHELMHSWIYENTKKNLSDKITEGSCNYVSYLYLRLLNQNSALYLIRMLENDPDKNYGKGFFEIRQQFEKKPIDEFLDFLKN